MIQCRIRVHYIHVSHRPEDPDVISATVHRTTIIAMRTMDAVHVTAHRTDERVDANRRRHVITVAAVTVRTNVWAHLADRRWKNFVPRLKVVVAAVAPIAVHVTQFQLVPAWRKQKLCRQRADLLLYADDWYCVNATVLVAWNLPAYGGRVWTNVSQILLFV